MASSIWPGGCGLLSLARVINSPQQHKLTLEGEGHVHVGHVPCRERLESLELSISGKVGAIEGFIAWEYYDQN